MKTNLPVDYKELKIRPKLVTEDQAKSASFPTSGIIDAFIAVKNDYASLDRVKREVSAAREQFEAQVRIIESNYQKLATELTLKIHINSLAALIANTTTKVVDFGTSLIAFVEEEKELPFKLSDKDKLERVVEKFPEVKAYLNRLDASMKKYDKSETTHKLIEWTKHPVEVEINR